MKNEKIINVSSISNKTIFKSDFKDYKDDYWIIGRLPDMNVRADTVFSEHMFYSNKDLVIKVYNFLLNEKKYITDKSLHVLCYDLRYFFKYTFEKQTLLHDIDYHFLDNYAAYLKKTGQSKNKYEKAKKILNKMKKYDFFSLHSDIYKNNMPIHLNFSKPTKKEDMYNEDVFKSIGQLLTNVIEDYFKGVLDTQYFIKASYWLIAFCTGFNKTAMDNLNVDSFIKTFDKNNDSFLYVITGLKNRGVKGYQQSRLSIKRNHLLHKVIEEIFRLNITIEQKYNISRDNSFLFHYEQHKKNSFLKKYIGGKIKTDDLKSYFDKYNLNDVTLSTQKMRNQWSLKMLSISESINKVSQMLDHSNTNITLSYYLKSRLDNKNKIKFKLFQELLYQYSHNTKFNKWTEFQNCLGISDKDLKVIIDRIQDGYYESATGKCLNQDNTVCNSYFDCFNCKNFSVVGEKDLWKLMSMRQAILNIENIKFTWVVETIDDILKDFDRQDILSARKFLHDKGPHPFWRNPIMIKTLIKNYEAKNV